MRSRFPIFPTVALMVAIAICTRSFAETARVNAPAPAFTATDSRGQSHALDQYKGKYVVLEWHNQGCPFTRKHYESGNMQALQKQWTEKGVVWLTVISSGPGKEGYVTASQENEYMAKMHASPTAALLDPEGSLGRLYNAKTTPDMFVIDPQGKLIYSGAIDDRPSTDLDDVKGADNYVSDALSAAMSGKPVAKPYTRAYGCSVKYRD
jgi:peroxiredoxin